MVYDSSNVPTDPAVLQELVINQSKTIGELNAKLDKALLEIQRISLLFEKFFNKSSQKLLQDKERKEAEKKAAEEALAAQAPENTPPDESDSAGAPEGKRNGKGGGGRNPLPEHLPRIEQVVEHEVPVCDICGKAFNKIGEERSEQLHFKPMELFVLVTILYKYIAACECSEKRSETVESPVRAVDHGVAGNSLVAAVIVQKYMDHLPIARQSKQLFRRAGVHLPESSMCRWMGCAAELTSELYDLMHCRLFGGLYVHMDATNVKYLDPDIKGKSGLGTIWGYSGDETAPYVLYDFQTHGKRAGPAAFLKGYDKYVVCDANTVNHGLFVPEGTALPIVPATEVGCWSHCRSNFVVARRLQPAAMEAIKMIGLLYGVERRAKRKSVEERLALRQETSVPTLDMIFDWCRENVTKYELPTDLLGKAIRYALNQELVLRVYCTDGRLPIDNNEAERILRLIAIGRKNWQFYGSANGGKTGAVLHSLMASAHRHGLNEYEYMLDVLDRLADLGSTSEIASLLPDRWMPKAAR